MLALAPGGMIEMTILTYSIGIEVAFVVTSQISRILFVMGLVPVLFNLTGGKAKPPDKRQYALALAIHGYIAQAGKYPRRHAMDSRFCVR